MKPAINFQVLFMTMLMRSPTPISLVETNGRWIWSSDRYTQMFGPNNSNIERSDRLRLKKLIEDTADWQDDVQPVVLSVIASDGVRRVFTFTAENMLVDRGFRGVCLYAKDTTLQYAAENNRITTENYLVTLVKSLNIGVLLMDNNFDILLVNQKFMDIFQVPLIPEEVIGRQAISLQSVAENPYADQYYMESRGYAILGGSIEGWHEIAALVNGINVLQEYSPVRKNGVPIAHLWLYTELGYSNE